MSQVRPIHRRICESTNCGLLVGTLLALYAHAGSTALANTDASCLPPLPEIQAELRYLRRLSLDFRGRLPSVAEAQRVIDGGSVPSSLIDEIFASEGLDTIVRTYHRDLLWANVQSVALTATPWILVKSTAKGTKHGDGISTPLWTSQTTARPTSYRGGIVSCLNEPARFDADGIPIRKRDPQNPAIQREGYVMVAPYWDPKTPVKVCAFDAQEAERVSVEETVEVDGKEVLKTRVVDCSEEIHPRCGCGPNLRYCIVRGELQTENTIRDAIAQQLVEVSARIVRERLPYTELLVGKETLVNGPISHYLRHQLGTAASDFLLNRSDLAAIPTIPFIQESTWKVVSGGEKFSGVLTSPLFLMRFATDRARANRFYETFLCKSFQAPSGGLPSGEDACNNEPNLQLRCGCNACHQSLEPLAAYWGRWAERGYAYLSSEEFPILDKKCQAGSRSRKCRLAYFEKPKEPEDLHPKELAYVGKLQAYVFATEAMEKNITSGPARLAGEAIASGEFARCTVRKVWRFFVGDIPAVTAGSSDFEEHISKLAEAFRDGGYDFAELLRAVAESSAYRSASLTRRGTR